MHPLRSPSALLSAEERDKIFLEVHIQNLTQEPLWFERMDLEPVDGWKVNDENVLEIGMEKESIFTESAALMQPQDLRQYVYTLVPTVVPSFPVPHVPGSIIPLGRLDISWRSGFGEPGRLLTSVRRFLISSIPPVLSSHQMLSRRIPLPPAVQAASAIPPYLQRTNPPGGPPRPNSPSHAPMPSRPGTPPVRPGSPYRARTSASISSRPQSPGLPQSQTQPLAIAPPTSDLEADLIIRDIPREDIEIEKPFNVACTMRIAGNVPPRKCRIVRLAVQTLQSRKGTSVGVGTHSPSGLPHFGSLLATPSPTSTPWRGTFTLDKPPVGSPEQDATDIHITSYSAGLVGLPSPFVDTGFKGVLSTGSSSVLLSEIRLTSSATDGDAVRVEGGQDFTLSYIPVTYGFLSIGGLRVFAVEDRLVDDADGESTPVDGRRSGFFGSEIETRQPLGMLREWSVIGEIWVKTK